MRMVSVSVWVAPEDSHAALRGQMVERFWAEFRSGYEFRWNEALRILTMREAGDAEG